MFSWTIHLTPTFFFFYLFFLPYKGTLYTDSLLPLDVAVLLFGYCWFKIIVIVYMNQSPKGIKWSAVPLPCLTIVLNQQWPNKNTVTSRGKRKYVYKVPWHGKKKKKNSMDGNNFTIVCTHANIVAWRGEGSPTLGSVEGPGAADDVPVPD